MGSEFNDPSRAHYDISMSRRTRRPLKLEMQTESSLQRERPPPLVTVHEEEKSPPKSEYEGQEDEHKISLKKLIQERSATSLGQHFTAEAKQLQLVVKQHSEASDGLKFRTMVSRCTKILGSMIKMKRDPNLRSRKKQVPRFTM